MPSLPYTLLDVFTATPLTGNGLAVVHDADALDDDTMLRFARETRMSETTFVQAPTEPGADYRNRIFMTTRELDFAGHPSLGTAVAVARRRGASPVRYTQQTRAGLQPVDVEVAGFRARASMLQEPAEFGAELDPGEVLAAAGLSAGDAAPGLPAQVVSTGAVQILVPLGRPEALARARPDDAAVAALIERHGAVTLYLVHHEETAGTAQARSFFPDASGRAEEDPATGSAAGPLAAYLNERGRGTRVEVTQGVEMGRPSRLTAAIEGAGVRVGGDVVVIVDGTVHL